MRARWSLAAPGPLPWQLFSRAAIDAADNCAVSYAPRPVMSACLIEELIVLQRLVAELNKEQEALIASKHTEKGEAVAPWVGAPNEDVLREECLSLTTVSNSVSPFIVLLVFMSFFREPGSCTAASGNFLSIVRIPPSVSTRWLRTLSTRDDFSFGRRSRWKLESYVDDT